MSQLFPRLFEPLEIRGKRFKNRLFLAAHGTGYAESGQVGDQGYAYYEARVKRDISLLITEAAWVVPLEGQKYAQLSLANDASIPRFERLAELCHAHDCRYFGQVYHVGRARGRSYDGSLPVAVAPSSLPDERFHIVPRALTITMIEDLVARFGAATERLVRSGADGVELLVGMGYLHSQFLSPRINVRTDRYGGSLEGRVRFLRETLQSMRAAAPEDFIIGIRVAGEEYDPQGMRPDENLAVCELLEQDGLFDYVNVAAAGTHGLIGASHIVPPMSVDTGQTLPYAEAVRKTVSVPVFTCGRINQPHEAERAIASGQTDMVGMVRALITDPEFVIKAREDRPDDIRACIACDQACIGHRLKGFGVSCIQFPESGRELEYGTLQPAATPKRVYIAGGGPAGMKAAVVAAQRGHVVTLFERSTRLGGQALLAQALPGRAEFGGLVTNLERELQQHAVTVRTGTELTARLVEKDAPDIVVVATGAMPYEPDAEYDEAHVVTAWDVLQNQANIGKSVVVADWRCDWVGMGIAEKLAMEGCSVRLCVTGEMAGQTIPDYVRYLWTGRLHSLGVEVIPYVRLHGADSDTVYMQHMVSGEAVLCEETDTLVLAYGHQPVSQLEDALTDLDVEVHAIGDCVSPRTAEEAILEGLKVGAIL